MGIIELKKELNKLEKDKIIAIVVDLYKKNKSVKDFFDYYVTPNEIEAFEKYKEKVFLAFYPKRGFGFKLKDGKQAISDFKKLEPSSELVSDLMLFYVETGVMFTNDFGDISESFYSSIETVYHNALTLMKKENLLEKFMERANKVVTDTENIGWGFHDSLYDSFSCFYK